MSDGAENFTIRIDNSQLMQDAANSAKIIQGISDSAERTGREMDSSIKLNDNRLSSEAAHVNQEIANIGSEAVNAGSNIESAFKKAGAAIGIAFGLGQVKAFAGEVMSVRANMESLQTSFVTLLGSEEKGKELFSQLREFGASTPLELGDLAQNAKVLLSFGTSANDVLPILKDLGDVSQGDAQKLSSLTLAFSQATSAGKLQGQDWLQMINAGFNPLQQISERTGKSMAELKDEMSKGAISADMLRQAFADATAEGGKFHNALQDQSKVLNGAKSNLDDAISMAYNEIGEKLEPAVMTGINLAQEMVSHWQQIGKVIIDIVAGYGTYKAAVMLVSAVQRAAINQQIAGYQVLLPAKKASMDADLQEMVARGRITTAKAMELQAIRQEVAAKIQEMQTTLQQANIELQASRVKYQAATRDLIVARQKQAMAQSQMRIALAGGNAEEIAAAKTAAATAKKEVQTAAMIKNTASKALNSAQTNRNTIATELDTLQTNANAVSKKSAATATAFLTLATNGLTKAWEALKLAFVSNPLGAVVTIGLTAITTLVSLKDMFSSTTDSVNDLSDAQADANKEQSITDNLQTEASEAATKQRMAIEQLNKTLHNNEAKLKDRREALIKLKKIVPDYHAQLSKTGQLINDNTKAIDKYVQGIEKMALAEALYERMVQEMKKSTDARMAKKVFEGQIAESHKHDSEGYDASGIHMDASVVNSQRNVYRQGIQKQINAQQAIIDKTNKNVEILKSLYSDDPELAKMVQDKVRTGGESGKLVNPNELSGEDLSPKTKSKHTGSGKTEDDYAEQRAEEERKYSEEQKKQEVKNQQAIDQAVVDAKAEGEEKRLAQAALNHEKQMQQIDAEYSEIYSKEVEHQKKLFETDKANKGKNFYSEHPLQKDGTYKGISLPEEDKKGKEAEQKSEDLRYGKEVQGILQESMDALISYYKEFGTLEEQRYAIAKDYDDKIAKATTQGQKMTLEAQKQKDIAAAGANSLAMDIDWSKSFEGVGNVLGSIAKTTLEKVEQYMNTDEFKKLKPADQKAYVDLREKLNKETNGNATSPFNFKQWGTIAQQVKKYQESVRNLQDKTDAHKKAVKELQEAEERLKNATDKTAKDIAQSQVDAAASKVSETGQQETDAKKDVEKNQQDLNDSTQKASKGLQNFSQALQEISSGGLYGFANGIAKLITSLSGDTKSLEQLGGKIGGIIGAILQIIDALGDDPKGFIDNLFEKVINTVQSVVSNLPELTGMIIKNVGALVGGVIDGIGVMFGADSGWLNGSNVKEVQELTDRLTKSNDALKTSIDSLKETIDNENGVNAISDTQKALDAQQRVNQNQMEILKAQMSYHSKHHSNAHYWNLESDDYNQINEVLAEYASRHPEARTTTNSVYSLKDIYKLTPEQMNEIRTRLADVWTSMLEQGKYDKSEYWTAYADLAGKMEEITDGLREKLTGITFDSMHDDFVEKLMDMKNKAGDFAKDINQKFTKGLLNFAIGSQMDAKLKQWWQNWADTMQAQSGNLTESQIENMRTEYEAFVNEGTQIRDRVFKVTGYGGAEDYSQDSSKSVLEGVTQDQVQELNGRMTSVQINIDKIAEQIQEDYKQNGTILATTQDIRSLMDDLVDLQNDQIGHLQKIEIYTSELPTMNEKLEKIRKSVEHL